ncbi:Transcription factor ORG2 [Linum perenne]
MMAMSSNSSFSSHQSNINPNFSSSNWPLLLDDPLITLLPNLNYHHLDQPTNNYPFPPAAAAEEQQVDGGGGGTTAVKKMNHNASERQRRKKINALYSSLRGLLPSSDHHPTKKLSIPTTVSKVVKYIPELQQQVETLTLRKKQLLSTLPHIPKPEEDAQTLDVEEHVTSLDHNRRGSLSATNKSTTSTFASSSSSSTVSTSWLSDEEVMVQLSVDMTNNIVHVSDVLFHLEEECGLVVLNSSSFQSPRGMVFYNLHLQVEGSRKGLMLDSKALGERLMSLLDQQGTNPFCS